MYVIVKNDTTVLSHGINKHTWKYLDECQEYAAAQATPGDTIQICELKPKYVYNMQLICEEPDPEEPTVNCGCGWTPVEPDGGEETPPVITE